MPTSQEGRSGGQGHKTLALRLDDDLHAQLTVIAQLQGHSLTEEIRLAIEAHIEATRSQPELADKAGSVLADIDREAETRRSAIAALFSSDEPPATGGGSSRRSGRKSAGSERDTPS